MYKQVISSLNKTQHRIASIAFLLILQFIFVQSLFAGNLNNFIPPPTVYSTTDSTVCANDLPIVWNGLTFTSAGSQTALLVSSTNEDSLATLNLTVSPVYNIGYNLTICQNQIPFSWSGLTFYGPGTQTAFLTSSLNCDSLVTFNISVIPFIPFSKDTVVCANEVPFVWNGLTFTQSGSQMAIISSPNNCDIGYTLNLTVVPVQTSVTNLSICSDDLPFTWNGLTFNGAGTQTTMLNNYLNCDSIATLNLTVNPVQSSTTNLTICNSQLPYLWNGLTFFIPGTQTTTITSSLNCDSIVTLNLAVNPTSYSYAFATICADELPYEWNGLTFNSATTQSITLTNSIGCDSVASFALTVLPNTYTYNFMTICESELPFVWNGLTFTETGIQTAILTNSLGCNFYATLDLVVRPILYSTTNLTICETDLPFSWNGFILLQAGSETATLTSSINCDSIATLNLSVTPIVSSTTDLTICEGQLPYSWNGLTFSSAGTQIATLTSSLNCDSLATLNLSVNPTLTSSTDISICSSDLPYSWNGLVFTSSGSQTATLTSATSCDSLATLNLNVISVPQAPNISPSRFYCDAETIEPIYASANLGGTLTWYSDENLTIEIGTGEILNPDFQLGETVYFVVETLENCQGASANTSITIEVCPIDIPTAFTPDGDGMNDTWQIIAIDENYPNALIQIYNRWGNLIFEHQSSPSNLYNANAWNGRYEEKELPVSSYYYLINYNDDKATPVLKGTVSIIRN